MKKVLVFTFIIAVLALPVMARGNQEKADEQLVWVWYPNESTPEFADARRAIIEVAEEALGQPIKEQLTTDYAIAIEALANENAAFSWLGGEGYVQAHSKEAAILPLVVNTGSSGTLADAKYYSMLGTLIENDDQYKTNGKYNLDNLRQKRFSFVSNSSTSGFRVPSSIIKSHFNVEAEDLLEGGPNMVFSEVMFGGSHQGSFFNVLTGKADLGAFCNSCVKDYIEWVDGSYDDPAPGDVIRVIANADAPFDQVPGKEVVLVATVPVLNAPIVMNTNLLDEEQIEALKEAFTSDATAANERIFAPKGVDYKALFHAGQRFATVDDNWYDPIRALAK
ncbi:MAG: phosphonate ABC transporter substrate-binding protein [Spirochaetaceae bacterium]|nr:MAG: phosphonate ABC transporter substrate-binding protein [Spirochaetaceae bacterium]